MLDDHQRRLLGEFVRAHRELVRGRAGAGRRRTPGLRREELAEAAGISTTWCAWIEQGRPVQPSPEALARLAGALQLSAAERAYLFKLSGRIDPSELNADYGAAPSALRVLVDALPTPAYGLDRLWNARCWNAPAAHLFRGWLDGAADRNLLRFIFLSEDARRLIPDWRSRALRLLAEFRADYGGIDVQGLMPGELRELKRDEVEMLRAQAGKKAEADKKPRPVSLPARRHGHGPPKPKRGRK